MLGNRGFTLIELMVTIAVIAILAMIAAPSMGNMVAKQRLNSTTRELVDTLSTARSQAILLRQSTTLNLEASTANTGTVFNWKPTGAVLKSATDNPIFFTENGRAAKEVNNPAHTSDPTQPAKIKEPTTATFVVCNEKISEIRTITIMLTGGVESVTSSSGSCP